MSRSLTTKLRNESTDSTVWDYGSTLSRIHSFGVKGRDHYIQKLCRFTRGGERFIIAGRKGLIIDIYDEEYELVTTKKLLSTKQDSDFFIGLQVINETELKACSGLGYCYFFSIEMLLTSSYDELGMSFGLHGSVGFFKHLADPTPRVIVGGKDREITVIELESHKLIWKSKCVKRTHFEDSLLEPVWIQDTVIVQHGLDEHRFIAASRFGALLIYDPLISRQPLEKIQVSENPIRHIHMIDDTLFIADAFNNVTLLHYPRLKVINKFKIPIGPLGSVALQRLEPNTREGTRFLVFATGTIENSLKVFLVDDGYPSCLSSISTDSTVSSLILEGCIKSDTNEDTVREVKRLRHGRGNQN